MRVCVCITSETCVCQSQLVCNNFDGRKLVCLASSAGHNSLKIPCCFLSAFRSLPKALPTGPACGEFV